MIVRNEVDHLGACLASLGGLVDEIVIYDTGSIDGTPELARRVGARVLLGHWDGDFARARNAALDAVAAEWALIVDADERLVCDPHVLRRILLGVHPYDPPIDRVDAFWMPVVHLSADGDQQAAQLMTRLFRTDHGRWQGRVHESVELLRPDAGRALLPARYVFIEHLGYAGEDRVRAKGERNLALVLTELDELVAARSEDREAGGRVLFGLARSFLAVGRRQDAVDALETLREITGTGVYWALGTALLAQVLLDAGGFELAGLVLEAELRAEGGTDPRLADWLRARALSGLGEDAEALELLRGIDVVVDPAGTALPVAPILRLRAELAGGLGQLAEARSCLLTAISRHGAVRGNGPLLLSLFAGDEDSLVEALAEVQAAAGERQRAALLAELSSSDPPGPALAAQLARSPALSR
jgi:tetratricopeptide (TPR) repeat protein